MCVVFNKLTPCSRHSTEATYIRTRATCKLEIPYSCGIYRHAVSMWVILNVCMQYTHTVYVECTCIMEKQFNLLTGKVLHKLHNM